jgi:T5SS/PEP-CTERM-associated repeat protein
MRTTHRSREKMFRSALSLTIVSLFFVFTSCTGLFAQTTYNWNPLSTNFGSSFNWSPGGGPPGELDTAVFNTGAASTVTFNYSPFNASLQHQSGNTTFASSGGVHTYTPTGSGTAVNVSGGSLTLGTSGNPLHLAINNNLSVNGGTLNVLHGSQVTAALLSGFGFAGSTGTINVSGTGSALNLTNTSTTVSIGNTGGTGTLTFSDGATGSLHRLNLGVSTNAATQGTLNVLSGSNVTTGLMGIGTSAGTGTVTVSGTNSSLVQSGTSTLTIGSTNAAHNPGTLNIQSGGKFNTGTGTTTVNATGSINVGNASAGGEFNVGGEIVVNGGTINLTHTNTNFTAPVLTINGGQVIRNSGSMSISTDVSTTGGGNLSVGRGNGTGTLNISNSGVFTNSSGAVLIGADLSSIGVATVSGSGSQWNNSAGLFIGSSGHGMLNIQGGGTVANTFGIIGNNANSTGEVMVSGSGSQWNNSNILEVGTSGHGTLSIQAGGIVSNTFGYIGRNLGTGIATVHGNDSQWNNSGFLVVGNFGHGTLNIEAGGFVSNTSSQLGSDFESIGVANVTCSGSQWNNSSSLSVGQFGHGTLNIAMGGVVSNSIGRIGDQAGSTGVATVNGSGSQWNSSSSLIVGSSGFGELTIGSGGVVSNELGYIGFNSPSVGTVNVSGSGSQWNNSSILRVGNSGQGTLNIETAGVVSNTAGYIGYLASSTGSATVTGIGSQWNNSGFLSVGYLGNGTLNIADGGGVSNSYGLIASEVGSTGVASVSGNESQWNNAVNLSIGGNDFLAGGQGTLTIGPGGTVTVGETLRLWNNGTLNLYGGTLALDGYGFNAVSGSTINFLSGTVRLASDRTLGLDNAVAGLFGTVPQISTGRHLHVLGNATLLAPTTINGGTLTVHTLANGRLLNFNTGTLNLTGAAGLTVGSSGALGDVIHVGNQQTYNISHTATVASDGVLSVANGGRFNAQTLNNFGEVIMGGNLARITTSPLTTFNNHGLLSGAGRVDGDFYNHAGGIVELEAGKRLTFTDQMYNLASGRIIGRGQLVAPDINNYGQMLFSGGFTDIQSTITGYDGSQLIITGGGTTSVFGDVEIKGGAELRISDLSNGVFFDHVQLRNGALITGGGNSYFEGSLGIGDSPSRQEFSFNVNLGALSNLIVEIGGTDPFLPEFDQFVFLKDLNLQGGMLTVDLIGLNSGDPAYLPLLGDSFQFIEVTGNWTGSFGTLNLPTLSGGLQWNTSQLYSHGTLSVSAIPEPSSALLLMISLAMFIGRRRVRVGHSRSNLHKTF